MALLVGMAMEGGPSAGVLVDVVDATARGREPFPVVRRNTVNDNSPE